METITMNSLREFEEWLNQEDTDTLNQYKVLFLDNGSTMVSFSDGYNRFYYDMQMLVSHIKAYQYFNVSFEDEITSLKSTVETLILNDNPCMLSEDTNLVEFLNQWGEYQNVKNFIFYFNEYNQAEKQFLELSIDDMVDTQQNYIEEQKSLSHSHIENDLDKLNIDCSLKDYISFQIYCNYVTHNLNDVEYNLILSNQNELYNMISLNSSLEQAIYYTLVKNAPYSISNELIQDKLLLQDNPILKVYNGTWNVYDKNVNYENVQAYRINSIDITGTIYVNDVSFKNYNAIKSKTEDLKCLYSLCKSINESNSNTETSTIMFTNQAEEKEDRIVFCQEICRCKNTFTWKLNKITMAGTLAECIHYKEYSYKPIFLDKAFIKDFIQKDNIIEDSLLSKLIAPSMEFFILRPTSESKHIILYSSPVTITLTKDINSNLNALIEYFKSHSNNVIQTNDIIMLKKKSTQQALIYKYLDINNFQKISTKNLKF